MTDGHDLAHQIDADADAALAAVPPHLRTKAAVARTGSTRLVFSDRSTRTTNTRKAHPHDHR